MVNKSDEISELAGNIGRNIEVRRKHLSWTQGQFAQRVGVDAESISRFERGVHLPSYKSQRNYTKQMSLLHQKSAII